jgi:DNA-binding IclR family transcriptional regulator
LVIKLLTDIQIPHEYLVILAREEMSRLVEVTGETISLAVLVGQQFHSLYEISGSHKLRVMEAISFTYEPLSESSSASQVLLAQIREQELLTRLKNIKFQSGTDEANKYNKLLSQIRQVRDQGYAISLDEVIPGCVSISAPINNYLFPTVLSIFGPKNRMKSVSKKYVNNLRDSAHRISTELGDKFKNPARFSEKQY